MGGGLQADLVLETGLEAETEFADPVLGKKFNQLEMGDGCGGSGGVGRDDVLIKSGRVQLHEIFPGTGRGFDFPIHVGDVFAEEIVGPQLRDQVGPGGVVQGDAEEPTGVLVEPVHGKRLNHPGMAKKTPSGGFSEGVVEIIGKHVESRFLILLPGRNREEAGLFVDDGEIRIEGDQDQLGMDALAHAPTPLGLGRGTEGELIPGIGKAGAGFGHHFAMEAETTPGDPFLDPVAGGVGT